MDKPTPLPKLHEPNAEARARGYLRGAVVRWTGCDPEEGIGIVVGHDSEGDPLAYFGGFDASAIAATSACLSLEHPAEPAPAPTHSKQAEILAVLGIERGHVDRALRVTGGDTARAVDLLLLIFR